MMGDIGIKQKLSTAYHPQTDGQTERMNQTLEQHLRHYVNYSQKNWVQLLPMAQLAMNNRESTATGETPFFANYGKQPNLFLTPRETPKAEKALEDASDLKRMHEEMSRNITFQQLKTEPYANKKRKKEPQLKEGDKVYLLTKNLSTTRPSRKLDHVKVGPFFVRKKKSDVNFELDLPKEMRIHPVFHVSLLEPADPQTPVQTRGPKLSPENEYEVEAIKDYDKKSQLYLVKWKGYDDDDNTWEPRSNLNNCDTRIREFENSLKNPGCWTQSHRRQRAATKQQEDHRTVKDPSRGDPRGKAPPRSRWPRVRQE